METLPDKFEAPMVKVSQATVETVKKTVFKGATDEELQLFFHKCLSVGCHPLDELIFPVKFKDNKEGGFTLIFISSIDLMRAKAEETEEYDGQDEPEFTMGEHDDKFTHPTKATVNVYRKGIDRPFVGVANWSEFFPSDEKKQFFWKKMPHVQIGKCAEAQGLRKAFPKKLNKLYAEEEMHQAIEAAAKKESSKPEITQPTLEVGAEIVESGVIEEVTFKKGVSKKGPWTKYGITINGVKYPTFDKKLADYAKKNKGSEVKYSWKQDGNYKNLVSIDVEPEVTEEESETETPKDETKPTVRIMTKEIFEQNVRTLGLRFGLNNDDDINTFLYNQTKGKFGKLVDLPETEYSWVLELFDFHAQKEDNK